MNNYVKRIVCLANSIKHHPSRCIAGREMVGNQVGNWIRPVTLDEETEGAISPAVSVLNTGRQIAPLDIVDITFVASQRQRGCQTENHVVAPVRWQFVGQYPIANFVALAHAYPDLWNVGSSTRNGENDQISELAALNLGDSLRLIEPTNFTYGVKLEGMQGQEKKAIRGSFSYNGEGYILKITDPVYTAAIPNLIVDHRYTVPGRVFICVSIGDVFRGNHYKLIATIFSI